LNDNFQMDWEYDHADNGNIAMTAEVDLSLGNQFTIGIGMGGSCQSAATKLIQAFVRHFDEQRAKYVEQWKRTVQKKALTSRDRKTAAMVRLSQSILLAHEDKMFAGATVASMSIPWGETKDDSDRGGYHLVWARDMVQTTTALMACGEMESPLRALTWLSCVQGEDGGMPQNSTIDGTAYWKSLQLDEVAAPVVLAWRLLNANALQEFDPWTTVRRAAMFLILHGPVTAQECWEENPGYSPSTLAGIISAIICAAEFAELQNDRTTAEFLRDYGDWLVASLESWTVTNCGELVEAKSRHFVRITPETPNPGPVDPNPDTAILQIGNGSGEHPARNVVDGGFLQFVRLGILAADDPVVVESVAVIDQILKRELPQGACWRRYNHDGYGQHPDGSAFNGTGEGCCWPLLTGERGHYELAAGRDPRPLIKSMEGFASNGLLAEQLWDADDLPERELYFGKPAGSAMPLCWAHAEFISLVRSQKDGVCFDRIGPVYERYVKAKNTNRVEAWTLAHQQARISAGKPLRIICESPAVVHWSADKWKTRHDIETQTNAIGVHFADLPVETFPAGTQITFTFHWNSPDRWEGKNFVVGIDLVDLVPKSILPVVC